MPGYEGEVVRVDRRKGRAQVLIHFDKKEIKLWVGFDLISKASDACADRSDPPNEYERSKK